MKASGSTASKASSPSGGLALGKEGISVLLEGVRASETRCISLRSSFLVLDVSPAGGEGVSIAQPEALSQEAACPQAWPS
jgi:hypothetical protein